METREQPPPYRAAPPVAVKMSNAVYPDTQPLIAVYPDTQPLILAEPVPVSSDAMLANAIAVPMAGAQAVVMPPKYEAVTIKQNFDADYDHPYKEQARCYPKNIFFFLLFPCLPCWDERKCKPIAKRCRRCHNKCSGRHMIIWFMWVLFAFIPGFIVSDYIKDADYIRTYEPVNSQCTVAGKAVGGYQVDTLANDHHHTSSPHHIQSEHTKARFLMGHNAALRAMENMGTDQTTERLQTDINPKRSYKPWRMIGGQETGRLTSFAPMKGSGGGVFGSGRSGFASYYSGIGYLTFLRLTYGVYNPGYYSSSYGYKYTSYTYNTRYTSLQVTWTGETSGYFRPVELFTTETETTTSLGRLGVWYLPNSKHTTKSAVQYDQSFSTEWIYAHATNMWNSDSNEEFTTKYAFNTTYECFVDKLNPESVVFDPVPGGSLYACLVLVLLANLFYILSTTACLCGCPKEKHHDWRGFCSGRKFDCSNWIYNEKEHW